MTTVVPSSSTEVSRKRADKIEFAIDLFVIGEQIPPWTEKFIGVNAEFYEQLAPVVDLLSGR